ncbi:MAG: hypothetical protein OEX07_15615 [Gammaproteobacteria bacterium]|nr:hypothetical protein [Gammaproteobacteria bacterium]
MPRGTSGRIVIEVETDLKTELYNALEKEGLNLKQWFLERAEDFIRDRSQLSLQFTDDDKGYSREGGTNGVV